MLNRITYIARTIRNNQWRWLAITLGTVVIYYAILMASLVLNLANSCALASVRDVAAAAGLCGVHGEDDSPQKRTKNTKSFQGRTPPKRRH